MKINRNILNTLHSIAMKLSTKKSYTECDIKALISTASSSVDFEIRGYNDDNGDVQYIGCISDENISTQVSITDSVIEYNSILSHDDPYTFESSLNINNSIILLEDLFHKNVYDASCITKDGILKSQYKVKNNKSIDIMCINKDDRSVDYEEDRRHMVDIINTVIDHIKSNYIVSKIGIEYKLGINHILVWIAYSPKENEDIKLWSSISLKINYANEYNYPSNIIVVENKITTPIFHINRTRAEFSFILDTGGESKACNMIIPNKIKNTNIPFFAHLSPSGCYIEITSDEAVDTDTSNQFDCPIDLEDLCVLTVQIEK